MRRGYVLIVVIIVIVIVSILFLTQANLTQDNTATIARQEQMAGAHFLSRSAIDLTYAALMSASSTPGYTLKLDLFCANVANVLNDTLTFPEGTATVRVYHDGGFVAIESIARLNNSQATSTLTLRIDKSNYAETSWE